MNVARRLFLSIHSFDYSCRTFVVILVAFLTNLKGSEGIDLQCDFITVRTVMPVDVSGNLCGAIGLVITNQNDTITSVNGQSAPLTDVNILHIFHQMINYFPKGLDKFFPNLEAIQLLHSPLKTIEQADIRPFGSKLKKFILGGNQIESLDSDLFEYNSELRWIGFQENNLKSVGKNILRPLKKLQRAYFDDNECIDKAAMNENQVQVLVAELEEKCPGLEKSITSEISSFFSPIVDLFTHNDFLPAKSNLEVEESVKRAEIKQEVNETPEEVPESSEDIKGQPETIKTSVVNGSSRPDLKTFWQSISFACVAFFFFSLT